MVVRMLVSCRYLNEGSSAHLVLMNPAFYHDRLKTLYAQWSILWLFQNIRDADADALAANPAVQDAGGLQNVLLDYITAKPVYDVATTDAAAADRAWESLQARNFEGTGKRQILTAPTSGGGSAADGDASSSTPLFGFTVQLSEHAREWLASAVDGVTSVVKQPASLPAIPPEGVMKLINMCADWAQFLIPHAISKINRVSYGLLSQHDRQAPCCPVSRRLMAVPFIGKDVPSFSSEFAHPDVLIGLTVLAYRNEGMRHTDMKRLASLLKRDFTKQSGNKNQRPAAVLFERWKTIGLLDKHQRQQRRAATHSGGIGDGAVVPDTPGMVFGDSTPRTPAPGLNEDAVLRSRVVATGVLTLDLFQPADDRQIERLLKLIGRVPEVVHYYLRRMVFPDTMLFQKMKISACGHALGSSLLFRRRIGYSGTPSTLLPVDMQGCTPEPGSDGKIVNYLTSPRIVRSECIGAWSAKGLLRRIAQHPDGLQFHALIDTGALVTGMTNYEVAEFLLQELPVWFEGVVYLDQLDRQIVLLRSGRTMPLRQSGLPWDKRFTFYDQIHTTGMDIKQAPNAVAAITIGKDMVFRDYAQGAFRMRGIGAGQTIHAVIIPEVASRVRHDLSVLDGLLVTRTNAKGDQDVDWEKCIPAWLMLNSMRMEALQYLQLSAQELANIVRKKALSAIIDEIDYGTGQTTGEPEPEHTRICRFHRGVVDDGGNAPKTGGSSGGGGRNSSAGSQSSLLRWFTTFEDDEKVSVHTYIHTYTARLRLKPALKHTCVGLTFSQPIHHLRPETNERKIPYYAQYACVRATGCVCVCVFCRATALCTVVGFGGLSEVGPCRTINPSIFVGACTPV